MPYSDDELRDRVDRLERALSLVMGALNIDYAIAGPGGRDMMQRAAKILSEKPAN